MEEKDVFGRALTVIRDLKDRGQLVVGLKPPFAVTFEVREEILSPVLRDAGLDEKIFSALSAEIGEIVLAILSESQERYLSREVTVENGGDRRTEVESARKEREERVEQTKLLIDERLAARYQLKVSSKAPCFSSIDWDVKTKTFDARLGAMRLAYATLRLRWQTDFQLEPETFFSKSVFDSIQVNLTREEVDHFLAELRALRDQLESEDKGAVSS